MRTVAVERIARGPRQDLVVLSRSDLVTFCAAIQQLRENREVTLRIQNRSSPASLEFVVAQKRVTEGFVQVFEADRIRYTIPDSVLDYMEYFVSEGLDGRPFAVDHLDLDFDPPSNDRVTNGAWHLTVDVPAPYQKGLSRDELLTFLDDV